MKFSSPLDIPCTIDSSCGSISFPSIGATGYHIWLDLTSMDVHGATEFFIWYCRFWKHCKTGRHMTHWCAVLAMCSGNMAAWFRRCPATCSLPSFRSASSQSATRPRCVPHYLSDLTSSLLHSSILSQGHTSKRESADFQYRRCLSWAVAP